MMSDLRRPTRRALLKGGGLGFVSLAAGSLGFGPEFLRRAALAAPAPSKRRPVLVALFQRGAMDGLAAVSPLRPEAQLRRLRPNLFVGGARAAGDDRLIDLGVDFGLHPSLAPLVTPFRQGEMAIVHQVGSPDPTRSHFDAQDYMESGTPGRKGTRSGWLNRVVGELGHEAATPLHAVAISTSVPRSLAGPEAAIAAARIEDLRLYSPAADVGDRAGGAGFEELYEHAADGALRQAGEETFEALRLLDRRNVASYRPSEGVAYPDSELGAGLRQLAMLIKSDVGLEVGFVESGGWDTHVRQGAIDGVFSQRATDLARSIAAFWQDLGERRQDVVVLTMTEFGRTVRENGSGGTDHGHGSCLFVLGGEVRGGRVVGSIDSLRQGKLHDGRDLRVTTDFRSVFSAVARDHLGVDVPGLFPGWSGKPLRLFERS